MNKAMKLIAQSKICVRFYFLLCALLTLFQFNLSAQTLPHEDSVNFLIDVYRRSAEYYGYSNVFVRVYRSQKNPVKMNLRFLNNDNIHFETETTGYNSGFFSHGKNHVNPRELNFWNSSDPNLYDLQITLFDSVQVYLVKSLPVGIVDYSMKNENLLINNQLQTLNGKIVCKDLSFSDILSLKKELINTLVFNFIPNHETVLLCSKYGLYVIFDLDYSFNFVEKIHEIKKIINLPAVSYFIMPNTEKIKVFKNTFSNKIVGTSLPQNLNLFVFKDGYSWGNLSQCFNISYLSNYSYYFDQICKCGIQILVKDKFKGAN